MNDESMAPMTYATKLPHILNLSNGIIGVSILAMPFCMQQCGLLFGAIILLATSALTRISCNLLVKGAYFARTSSYESFALQAYGRLGKTAAEICLILYTKGTLIAFFVVIGDLGPLIFSDFIGGGSGDGSFDRETVRVLFMMAVGLFIILPLSLLKTLGSLSRISSLAIVFYGFLVIRIFVQSAPSLFSTDWWWQINWWQPSGLFQTLPIFALSLSCQTQLFVMASEIPDCSATKMDNIVRSALNLCSCIYLMVGTFGYVGFHNQTIGGDVLVLLDNSGLTKFIKAGFLFSLAVSYPIMVFPCRSAIYSMVFRPNALSNVGFESESDRMPPIALKVVTLYLIAFNLLIAVCIPNVELILSLCGSLVGSVICFVMPGLLFLRVCPQADTIVRCAAKVCVAVGIFTLVFSTYVSLREVGDVESNAKNLVSVPADVGTKMSLNLPTPKRDASLGSDGVAKRAINSANGQLSSAVFDVVTVKKFEKLALGEQRPTKGQTGNGVDVKPKSVQNQAAKQTDKKPKSVILSKSKLSSVSQLK